MKTRLQIGLLSMLAACAAQEVEETQDEEQAVRDFIAVRELAELDKMRTTDRDGWEVLDLHFLLYKTRRKHYLVEFVRACYELRENEIVADERWDANTVRARFDTIRGCRVDKIYALTEADVVELQQLGESPGSRN